MDPLISKVDELFFKNATRLAAQKEVDKMKGDEDKLLMEIYEYLRSAGLDEVEGSAASDAKVYLLWADTPEVKDWKEFQEHIRATGDLDLLQKRPMVSAIRVRWEEGKDVPGILRTITATPKLGRVK